MVTMPLGEGTYPVYTGVFSAGENIALYKAIEDVVIAPVVPPFTGFSLMIENPVAGAAYWFADFPYSAYTGKISMRSIDEAGWITQEAPGMDYIRILFLTADYQCPISDCEGLIFYLFFQGGHHYILNCATSRLRENPNPPEMPPPPVGEPAIVSVTIPSVKGGDTFSSQATVYLPILLPG
ncbi:unnamed protein product, partial [marine sediment metagenome]